MASATVVASSVGIAGGGAPGATPVHVYRCSFLGENQL